MCLRWLKYHFYRVNAANQIGFFTTLCFNNLLIIFLMGFLKISHGVFDLLSQGSKKNSRSFMSESHEVHEVTRHHLMGRGWWAGGWWGNLSLINATQCLVSMKTYTPLYPRKIINSISGSKHVYPKVAYSSQPHKAALFLARKANMVLRLQRS